MNMLDLLRARYPHDINRAAARLRALAAEFAAVEREAVAVERERCADYAENFITLLDLDWLREATKADCMKEVLTRCAAAIRGGG